MSTPTKVLLEVCIDSLEAALALEAAGADRLEICSDLPNGGLTPSGGLLLALQEKLSIPYHVLIRPRTGDFCYSPAEKEVILNDIHVAKNAGASGIVFGCLDLYGKIDEIFMREVLAKAFPLPVTFHRAYDVTANADEALTVLIRLGVSRLLTSGKEHQAIRGTKHLKEIRQKAPQSFEIIVASGVNAKNAVAILKATGVNALHFSALQTQKSKFTTIPNISFSHKAPEEDLNYQRGNPKKLMAIREALLQNGYLVHRMVPEVKVL